jgi:hypothetical protein
VTTNFFKIPVAAERFSEYGHRHVRIPALCRREEVVAHVERERWREGSQPQTQVLRCDAGQAGVRSAKLHIRIRQCISKAEPERRVTEAIARARETTPGTHGIVEPAACWIAGSAEAEEL